MTERSTFDAFERRVAGELARYVAPAIDPTPAADIADAAMQPRGLVVTARNVSRRRRLLVVGLAAAFLVPAVYVGSGGIRPAPVVPIPIQPSPALETIPTVGPGPTAVSVFVRRATDPVPGVSVFAVGPDGAETLIRHVADSAVGDRGILEWGTVSESGWLALAVGDGSGWPMVLVDLRDERAVPWVVPEANTGGIGPRWGPGGLIAADAGGNGGQVVIADPATHTTRLISMPGGLIGGGPSIVWAGDGSGIVSTNGNGGYQVVPIDGGAPTPGVGSVFDLRGSFGPRMASLQICTDVACAGPPDGRVERREPDGSTQTIWRQQGPDRPLGANFGREPDEYWLAVDHAGGTQISFVHVLGGREESVATVNRDGSWQYVAAPVESPDHSATLMWIDIGAKPAAVVVSRDGKTQTFHTGQFAGFVDGTALAGALAGHSSTPGQVVPAVGEAYRLPSLDQLIAAEQGYNPGRRVFGKASRDGVAGDTVIREYEVHSVGSEEGQVYLDCSGPAEVTVTSGAESTTNGCVAAGSTGTGVDPNGMVVVRARGDTSWRVVIYSP